MTDTPGKTEKVVAKAIRDAEQLYYREGEPSSHNTGRLSEIQARAAIKAHTECQDEVNHRDWLFYPDHERPRLQIPDRERLPKSVDVRYPFAEHWFRYVPETDLTAARARIAELEAILSEEKT